MGTAKRARRLRCCYREGFGRVRLGEYPLMAPSFLTPQRPPMGPTSEGKYKYRSITEAAASTKYTSLEELAFGETNSPNECFYHRLVQRDSLGREYVVVHTVCLDHMEELCGREWAPI